MFPIQNNQDLIRVLSEDQEFRDTIRRIILTDDLLDLPARFDRHAEETANLIREITVQTGENSRAITENSRAIATLAIRTDENTQAIAALAIRTDENTRAIAENSQAIAALAVRTDENTRAIAALAIRTDENTRAIAALAVRTDENAQAITKNTQSIDRLTSQVSRMGGQLSALTGQAFELKNRDMIRRAAKNLMGIRNPRLIPDVSMLIDDAWDKDLITMNEANDIILSDAIVQGTTGPDDHTVYLVAEISITVQTRDVERAKRRAALLAQATQSPAIPVVAGINIPPGTDESGGLAVIRLPTEAGPDPF